MRLTCYLALNDIKKDDFCDENTTKVIAEENDEQFIMLPNGDNIKVEFGFGNLLVEKKVFFDRQERLKEMLKEEDIAYLINKIKSIEKSMNDNEKSRLKAGIRLLAKELNIK
jgi:hypothetical protein